MNLNALKTVVTSKFGHQVLRTQAHSPKLLFGVGLVGFGATVVLASRATLKMDGILALHEQRMNDIGMLEAEQDDRYTDIDAKRDRVRTYSRTFGSVGKAYAPAVAVGIISVAALTGSHVVLTRRNVALTAAYTTVAESFQQYRARVLDDLGEEKEAEYYHGVKEIQTKVVDDQGKTKTVKSKVAEGVSLYGRVFDELNSKAWKPNPTYNKMFIQCQQSFANEMLTAKGFLLLNDVYELLGMERTSEGCIIGWSTFHDKGDGYVDFGLFDNSGNVKAFMAGDESRVLLDFNVDGPVHHLI